MGHIGKGIIYTVLVPVLVSGRPTICWAQAQPVYTVHWNLQIVLYAVLYAVRRIAIAIYHTY